MDCTDFLDSYSDFRDGRITDANRLRRLYDHVAHCGPCGRYDASVRHGVRALGEIEPSPEFRRRLRARIAQTAEQPTEPLHTGAAGIAAALMLAAAIALLVYSGTERSDPTVLPAAVAAAPTTPTPELPRAFPIVIVNPGVPFVTFTDLSMSPFRTAGAMTDTEFHVQTDVPLGTWVNLPR